MPVPLPFLIEETPLDQISFRQFKTMLWELYLKHTMTDILSIVVLLHYPVPSCDTTSGTSVVRCLMVERTHPWEATQGTWWQGRVCFRQIMLFLPAHHKVINSVTIRKTSLLWSFCCFNLNL